MTYAIRVMGAAVLAAGLSMSAAAAGERETVVQKRPVDAQFLRAELSFDDRPKPGYVLKWREAVIGGKIAICGVVAFTDPQLLSQSKSVLRTVFIQYDGAVIMRDMSFFARAPSEARLDTTHANCASTGVTAPRQPFGVSLHWWAKQVKV